ncbi:MAG: chromate transporter [Lachnospiraceae bacterium]|nr:chromate transporter [Lachnospiraceae bacterium]
MVNNRIWKACASMLKIGCIGFGGGNALIPVIQKTVVEEEKLLTQEAYEEDILIASITPGALPVELAGGLGKRLAGRKGMLLAAGCMALPGAFVTVLLTSLLNGIPDVFYADVAFITVGVMAYIARLLMQYVNGAVRPISESGGKSRLLQCIMTAGVFVLTCGNNFYKLLKLERTPFFGLSAIHIFIMVFFVLFFTKGQTGRIKSTVSALLCILYILCTGKNALFQNPAVLPVVEGCMLCLGFHGCITGVRGAGNTTAFSKRELIKDLVMVVAGILAACMVSAVICREGFALVGRSFLSSILSFGGGDAFLTVADGMFVQSGMIGEHEFYSQLVPIVNILPGSILCKTLSGIGYLTGLNATGSILGGYVAAMAGFICSVAASCGVFAVMGDFYFAFRDFGVFPVIRMWIRPVVSGLMLTVILSLMQQCVKYGTSLGCGYGLLCVLAVVYCINIFMEKKNLRMGIRMLVSVLCACVFGWVMVNL